MMVHILLLFECIYDLKCFQNFPLFSRINSIFSTSLSNFSRIRKIVFLLFLFLSFFLPFLSTCAASLLSPRRPSSLPHLSFIFFFFPACLLPLFFRSNSGPVRPLPLSPFLLPTGGAHPSSPTSSRAWLEPGRLGPTACTPRPARLRPAPRPFLSLTGPLPYRRCCLFLQLAPRTHVPPPPPELRRTPPSISRSTTSSLPPLLPGVLE
jgi:hypothetical protein